MVKMRIEGFKDLERQMLKLSRTQSKASARRILKKGGGLVLQAVNPPRKSGALAESYAVSTRLTRRQKKLARGSGNQVEVYVGSNDPAAIQTEFGNAHQAADPHLRPAWDATKGQGLDLIKSDLWDDVIKSIGRAERRAAKARK